MSRDLPAPLPAAPPAAGTGAACVSPAPLVALCLTEITSWGVLYYAFPVLAPTIAADTGWSIATATAAFSAALVLAALGGIPAGRLLDRHGPRVLMTTGSAVAALGLALIASAPNLAWFTAGWLLAGVAMTAVLYQPAFAALTRYYAPRHVPALTTLTLVAGLASTVFAPLTDALANVMDWRGVYLVLAAVLAVVTIPLHGFALRHPWPPAHTGRPPDGGDLHSVSATVRSRPFILLALAFTLSAFAMYAVMTNLIPLLTARGADSTTAAWALGLGGVGQVAGRLGYGSLARRTTVRARTVWILSLGAVTTAGLAVLPGPVALLTVIAVLAGAPRGITTLLQATAVTDRWGTAAYGSLSGILAAPVTTATALAPWAGAALATALGGYPNLFLLLTACAAVATVLATGPTPRP